MFCRAMEIGLLGSRIAYALKEPYLLVYIKSRDLNLLFIIDIFSHYDRHIGQSGADR